MLSLVQMFGLISDAVRDNCRPRLAGDHNDNNNEDNNDHSFWIRASDLNQCLHEWTLQPIPALALRDTPALTRDRRGELVRPEKKVMVPRSGTLCFEIHRRKQICNFTFRHSCALYEYTETEPDGGLNAVRTQMRAYKSRWPNEEHEFGGVDLVDSWKDHCDVVVVFEDLEHDSESIVHIVSAATACEYGKTVFVLDCPSAEFVKLYPKWAAGQEVPTPKSLMAAKNEKKFLGVLRQRLQELQEHGQQTKNARLKMDQLEFAVLAYSIYGPAGVSNSTIIKAQELVTFANMGLQDVDPWLQHGDADFAKLFSERCSRMDFPRVKNPPADPLPTLVCENVYLGGLHHVHPVMFAALGVRAVLSIGATEFSKELGALQTVSTPDAKEEEDQQFRLLEYQILDNGRYSLFPFFGKACQFISENKERGNVLIHCHRGVSRSATVVMAYVMALNKISYREAMRFVTQRRPIVAQTARFKVDLLAWEFEILGERQTLVIGV